jgi:VanZ family protein
MIKKNLLSISVAIIILALSLASANNFNKLSLRLFPGIDKVAHFMMYLGFMSVIIFENRKSILNQYQLILVALIPFFYGGLMELLQIFITSTRSGSLSDMLFNGLGIIAAGLCFYFSRFFRNNPFT